MIDRKTAASRYEKLHGLLALVNSVAGCNWVNLTETSESLCRIVGTYHVDGVLDATNIIIRPNGSFTWDSDSCDSSTSFSGRVVVETNSVILVSAMGREFDFPLQVSSELSAPETGAVSQVVVEPRSDGGIVTRANGHTLQWQLGRVCSVCQYEGGGFSTGLEFCGCTGARIYVPGVPPCR